MSVQVTVKLDLPKMRALVGNMTSEGLEKAARTAVQRARTFIGAAGRDNTGAMAREMRYQMVQGGDPMTPSAFIGTPLPYAKYQEYGTRAHGPVRAKYLRFKPKGSATFVFAKWVRGVTPAKFMQNTLDHVRPSDFI